MVRELPNEAPATGVATPEFKLPSSVWLIMVFALIFTTLGAYLANHYINERGKERFQFQSLQLRDAILERMRTYELLLRGGIGLFMSSDDVSRKEWHDYVANSHLEEFYPGIQAFGYSIILKANQIAAHEAKVQAEGFIDYHVHPLDPVRETYQSILYLEPFDWRNQRAFGYDMYSEPVRRLAIDRAIATRQVSISGKITLVQETARDVQAGFLMYLPLFKDDDSGQASDEARGVVYAAFRVNNLIENILGDKFPKITLSIFDGDGISPPQLMFSNNNAVANSRYTTVIPVNIGGHIWSMAMSSDANFVSDAESLQRILVPVFGVMFLLILYYFLHHGALGRHKEQLFSQRMLANEERFRLVIEASPSALVMINAQGVMTLVNAHAEQLFKYSRDEMLGKSVSMLLPSGLREQHGQHIAQYLRRPDAKAMSQRTDLKGMCSDGSFVEIEVGLTPIMFSDGQAVLATINDVSERKQAERERERYTSELERINGELDSFAYIASHDLKSPLRGIEQLSDWLTEDLADHGSETVHKYLGLIRNRVQRMVNLLDGLLAFSRVGRIDAELVETDTAQLVKDVFALVNTKPAFELYIETDMPLLVTAKVPLELVFRNLINNAIKHHDQSLGVIRVGSELQGTQWLFYVADDGPGIPERFQQKVFDIFQTLRPRDEVEGSGMGLSLVRKSVESLGGKIWIESEGRGCCFKFTWPEKIGRDADG
ncbi:histidine kinase [Shewanella mangrovi]|uniref:histidine kinase n=1 Tax=Shewanella mangrovi TaxID=1515746 RepID=A0A094JA72_9GAMM|nr:CHASE domain-containing protein [Shewanella mangrovi]KFZ36810.1 histidine kinase [Shewanella mangrovi]